MLTEEKAQVISKIYFDAGGFQSKKNTFNAAKKQDKTISYADVEEWFNKNTNKKTQLKGYNSYVAQKAGDEYQADLFFINDLENQEFKIGLLMIDTFSKFMTVIPIRSKQLPDVLAGIMEACQHLKGYPKTLYTDEEGGIYNQQVIDFLAKKGTRLVTTRTHAGVAERAIRTFKDMLYKRIEASKEPNPQWVKTMNEVLVTYNYGKEHAATKMTPDEARKPSNRLKAKLSMEMRAKHTRKYPDLSVGDYVRVYFKKKPGEKERVSYWSETKHKIDRISEYMGQSYYHLEGITRPYLRFEILKTYS